MEDRELIMLAAKAYNSGNPAWQGCYAYQRGFLSNWNPLADDGDAFRLALQLQIKIEYVPEMDSVMCSLPGAQGATSVAAIGDVELRNAIVRAAAQLGLTL